MATRTPITAIRHAIELERRLWLLRPSLIMAVVWALTIAIWLGLPTRTFRELTNSERYVSPRSILFIAFCLALFGAGSLLARSTPSHLARTSTEELWWATNPPLRLCFRFAAAALVLGGSAVLFTSYRSASAAGGAPALFEQFRSGHVSWAHITSTTVEPASVQGISTWVHALTAVAPLCAFGVCLSTGQTRRRFWIVAALGFALAFTQAVIHSERITAFQYPILFTLTYFLTAALAGRSRHDLSRLLRYLLVLAALMAALWTLTEVYRQFVNAHPGDPLRSTAAVSFAGDRFLAYVASNANNLSYLVTHETRPSYAFFLGRGIVTTLGLDDASTPVVGTALPETSRVLWEIYHGKPLTTFTAIGDVYRDLLWASAGVFLLLGFVVTQIWLAVSRGSLSALLIYPLCVISLLLSFQVFHWTETPFLIPVVILVLFSSRASHGRRYALFAPRPIGSPVQ